MRVRFGSCSARLILPILLGAGLILAGNCNRLIRLLFYPPEVQMNGLSADTPGAVFSHGQLATLLKRFVSQEGHVDYAGLKESEAQLDAYLKSIARASWSNLGHYERLALLLNAYNAITLKVIVENPGKSIRQIPGAWSQQRFVVAGRTVSLEDVEHRWIRPDFGEPRIHFALVCAARGCPRLRREPYVGGRLVEQLSDQTRLFFSEAHNFRWEPGSNRLQLSALMDWYRGDFSSHSGSLVTYLVRNLPEAKARALKASGDKIEIDFLDYSWELNGSW